MDMPDDRLDVRPVMGPAEIESSETADSAVAGVCGLASRMSRERLRSREVSRVSGIRAESGEWPRSDCRGKGTVLDVGEMPTSW